jgi:uncharacterized membrane-anchored protein
MRSGNKVAQVTVFFWIMKIAATTLGETVGDLLSMTLDLGYGVSSVILLSAFLVAVTAQISSTRFRPLLYWTVILLTSTAGTTMSDFMDRTADLGYARGSAVLIACLMTVLAVWRWIEGTLSVDDIETRRAELFYWTAILCSNTLGTAFGDYLADSSGLGFAGGAALIAGALALVVVATYATNISRVALFWTAFVLTRPFGATFGDVLTKPRQSGGLDFGTAGASAVLFAVLVAVMLYSTVRESRLSDPQ